MSHAAGPAAPIPEPPRKSLGAWALDVLLWGGVALVLVISFGPVDMDRLPRLFQHTENIRVYGRDLLDPDWSNWRRLVEQMWLTIQIALWGTFIAVFLAVPLGLAAARNIHSGL